MNDSSYALLLLLPFWVAAAEAGAAPGKAAARGLAASCAKGVQKAIGT